MDVRAEPPQRVQLHLQTNCTTQIHSDTLWTELIMQSLLCKVKIETRSSKDALTSKWCWIFKGQYQLKPSRFNIFQVMNLITLISQRGDLKPVVSKNNYCIYWILYIEYSIIRYHTVCCVAGAVSVTGVKTPTMILSIHFKFSYGLLLHLPPSFPVLLTITIYHRDEITRK